MPHSYPALSTHQPSWREFILVALGLATLAVLALRPSIRGNDGVGNYVYLASLIRGHDLHLADDYRAFDALKQYPYRFADLPVSKITGQTSCRYGVGSAILWSPFVGTVHGWLLAVDPDRADGLSRPYEWAVGAGTAFWAWIGLLMLYRRLRRNWDPTVCLVVIVSLIFATPLGFYMYAHGSMTHGSSFFAITGVMLVLEKLWHRPHHLPTLLIFGFLLSLITIIRFQDATWSILIGLAGVARCLVIPTKSSTGHGPSGLLQRGRSVLWLGLAALITAMPQMIAWQILYGSPVSGPTPYLDGSAGVFLPWPRYIPEVLFSERGGVLAWHPIMAIGLAGLVVLAWQRGALRILALLGLAGFVLEVLLVASWSYWWAGASFGNRFFISSLPFLALGIAYWPGLATPRWPRWGVFALIGLLCLWNIGMLIQYAMEMVPREDPMAWSQVIRQNLVDVPRLIWEKIAG